MILNIRVFYTGCLAKEIVISTVIIGFTLGILIVSSETLSVTSDIIAIDTAINVKEHFVITITYTSAEIIKSYFNITTSVAYTLARIISRINKKVN